MTGERVFLAADDFLGPVCEHCRGTGQPGGVKGGPQLGVCSWCLGTGHSRPTPVPASPSLDTDAAELVERLKGLAEELGHTAETAEAYDAEIRACHQAASLITSLVAERDALTTGKRAILPQTKEHAENLYAVAVGCLRSFGDDPEARVKQMEEALKEIARQRLISEMDEEDQERAAFDDGYEACVQRARQALAREPSND
jgi:hypothetical protein